MKLLTGKARGCDTCFLSSGIPGRAQELRIGSTKRVLLCRFLLTGFADFSL